MSEKKKTNVLFYFLFGVHLGLMFIGITIANEILEVLK